MYQQVTYDYWCTVGGLGGRLAHKLHKKAVYNGIHFLGYTYWKNDLS